MDPTRSQVHAGAARTWGDCALKLDPAFEHELRHVLHDREVCCPRCRYNLSGVEGERCPECGVRLGEFLRVADTTPWRVASARKAAMTKRVLRWLGVIVAGLSVGLLGQLLVWVLR